MYGGDQAAVSASLPDQTDRLWKGGIAQLGERLLCKQEVIGSIPFASTSGLRLIREDPSSVLVGGRRCWLSS